MSRVPLPLRLSTSLAMRAWFTPPGRPSANTTDRTNTTLVTTAGPIDAQVEGDGPLALIIHGWGADPAHLSDLAAAIAHQGFRSVVPYLPSRAGARRTDIMEVSKTVRGLVEALGMPEAVVAHSFGAMVARVVFADGGPRRAVYLAPLVKVSDALDTFADLLRLAPWARTGIHRRLEAWNPELWPMVNAVDPGQLPGASMLIVHDPADRDTSFDRAATLAALRPDTVIIPADGLGHRRIVADPGVMRVVGAFLSGAEAELLAG